MGGLLKQFTKISTTYLAIFSVVAKNTTTATNEGKGNSQGILDGSKRKKRTGKTYHPPDQLT